MCLLYELLDNMMKKFFSLSNQCKTIMRITVQLAIQYINYVDEENFLTEVMLEKDFISRDLLTICVELELLELI